MEPPTLGDATSTYGLPDNRCLANTEGPYWPSKFQEWMGFKTHPDVFKEVHG